MEKIAMDDDCGFVRDDFWFRCRAAAIIIENGNVLFATNESVDYFYSIGGAIKLGEKAEDAVMREVLEETGVRYEIERLAVIHENFFKEEQLSGFRRCHEIAFYYLMKPRGTQELHSNSYSMGVKEHMVWIPIDELDRYKAYPSFLKHYLAKPPENLVHIITDDRN